MIFVTIFSSCGLSQPYTSIRDFYLRYLLKRYTSLIDDKYRLLWYKYVSYTISTDSSVFNTICRLFCVRLLQTSRCCSKRFCFWLCFIIVVVKKPQYAYECYPPNKIPLTTSRAQYNDSHPYMNNFQENLLA